MDKKRTSFMVTTENNFPHRAWKETHFHEHNNDRKKV